MLLSNYCDAQYLNKYWCFGDSSLLTFDTAGISTGFCSLDTRGSAVSLGDSTGLLIYANTRATVSGNATLVWNKNNQLMQNGNNIVGEGWYKELIILPFDSELCYLFTAGIAGSSLNGLHYSTINLTLNSGLGAVVQKNVQLQPYDASDGLAAIKHGNGRDWWLFYRRWDTTNNSFYIYLVTPDTINLHQIQNIGQSTFAGFYRIEPSFDGERIACCTTQGIIETYDFDRCSGILSNLITIGTEHIFPDPLPWYVGCEWSYDKSKLYVTSIIQGANNDSSYLLQFDMNASNIYASRDTLHSFRKPEQPYMLELAPDKKIYLASAYDNQINFNYPYPDSMRNYINENLSVINYPDSLGSACDFQPYSFYLGGARTYYGLPNNPNYELGPLVGSLCDTLTIGVEDHGQTAQGELYIFYHPGWQIAFINAKGLKGKKYNIQVFDMVGHLTYNEEGKLGSGYYTKDLSMQAFAKGMYIVVITTEKEKLVKKFVRE